MKRRLPKNLSPQLRKLVIVGGDEQRLQLRLQYRSMRDWAFLEASPADLGVEVRSHQPETCSISVEVATSTLEAISTLRGVVYIDAQSMIRD